MVIPLPVLAKVPPREETVRWNIELNGDRVTLRQDGVTVELSLHEAQRIAEAILRRG